MIMRSSRSPTLIYFPAEEWRWLVPKLGMLKEVVVMVYLKKYRFSDSHLPQSLYLKETRKKLLKYIQAPFLRDTISPKDSNNLTKAFLL